MPDLWQDKKPDNCPVRYSGGRIEFPRLDLINSTTPCGVQPADTPPAGRSWGDSAGRCLSPVSASVLSDSTDDPGGNSPAANRRDAPRVGPGRSEMPPKAQCPLKPIPAEP